MRWYVKPEILELASQAGTCFSLKKERYRGNVVSMSARCEEDVQLLSERRCGEKAGHQARVPRIERWSMGGATEGVVERSQRWTTHHGNVARKLIVEGAWKQKRWYDMGLSEGKVCKGCADEERTEKHRLYHCPPWKEVRYQISEETRQCEQKGKNIKERRGKKSFSMVKKWESEKVKSWRLAAESLREHNAIGGSLQGRQAWRVLDGQWCSWITKSSSQCGSTLGPSKQELSCNERSTERT